MRKPWMKWPRGWIMALALLTAGACPHAFGQDGLSHYLMTGLYRQPDHEAAPPLGWQRGWRLTAHWSEAWPGGNMAGNAAREAWGVALDKALSRSRAIRLSLDRSRDAAVWSMDGLWCLTTSYNGYDTRRAWEVLATAGVAGRMTRSNGRWHGGAEVGLQFRHTLTAALSLCVEPQYRVMTPVSGRGHLYDDEVMLRMGLLLHLTPPYRQGGYGAYVRAMAHGSMGRKVSVRTAEAGWMAVSGGPVWWDGRWPGVRAGLEADLTAVHGVRLDLTHIADDGSGAPCDAVGLDYVAHLTHAALGNATPHRLSLLLTCGYNLAVHDTGRGLWHTSAYVGMEAGLRLEVRLARRLALGVESQLLWLPFDRHLADRAWHTTTSSTLRLTL